MVMSDSVKRRRGEFEAVGRAVTRTVRMFPRARGCYKPTISFNFVYQAKPEESTTSTL